MSLNLLDDWRVRQDPRRIVAELSELADAAALDPHYWEPLFQGIQQLVPDSRVAFQAHDESFQVPLPMLALNWDDRTLDAYVQHYGAINPWIPSWFKMPLMRAVPSNFHLEDRVLIRTEFYNDWLKPIGQAEFATGFKLVHERGRLAQFAVHFDHRRAEATHAALLPILNALGPRLRRALDCNRASQRSLDVLKGAFLMETLVDPAFLVNAERKLIDANQAATAMLASKFPFRLDVQDALRGVDAGIETGLDQIVARACARTVGSTGSSDFMIDHAERRLSVSALPIAPNLRSLALRGPTSLFAPGMQALILVRQLPNASSGVAALLQLQFKLTVSEARVATALTGGGTLVDIAARIGLQYDTARAHLKSVFAKTKTHNQRELLALMLRLGSERSGSDAPRIEGP